MGGSSGLGQNPKFVKGNISAAPLKDIKGGGGSFPTIWYFMTTFASFQKHVYGSSSSQISPTTFLLFFLVPEAPGSDELIDDILSYTERTKQFLI